MFLKLGFDEGLIFNNKFMNKNSRNYISACISIIPNSLQYIELCGEKHIVLSTSYNICRLLKGMHAPRHATPSERFIRM